ncbi:MAG: adenylate kinase [Alphaproteobacteria bacterium]|nr:adenylate kinase [Alphaproteobacteria bacterium]NCB50011.1 adenylate kinase [Alphaproteobacteria bacterium]
MTSLKRGKKLVMIGPPGSGKGTQSLLLQEILNVPHLSTGDMLREVEKENTPLARQVASLIDGGNFVPDELILELIFKKLSSKECEEGYILDGFPRTVNQAKIFDERLQKEGKELSYVIALQVPDEYIIERIVGRYSCSKCGAVYHDTLKKPLQAGVCDVCGGSDFARRADDQLETVMLRLKKYRAVTAPILAFYEEKGLLVCVDGTGPIDVVNEKVKKMIGLKTNS